MNPYPICRRIENEADHKAAGAAMRADGHHLYFPSHLIERGGEVIGAASLGIAPVVMVWNHTQQVSVRDSLHLARVYDSLMDAKGMGTYLIACDKSSPYARYMERVGFKPCWETQIFVGGTKA